jgi:hypothetical protein
MTNPDQETVLRAVEDARRILGEYIGPGPGDATLRLDPLIAVLDRHDFIHARDRMKRRRILQLLE